MDALTLLVGLIASLSVGAFALAAALGAAEWSRERTLMGRLTRYVAPLLPSKGRDELGGQVEQLVGILNETRFGRRLLRDIRQLGPTETEPGRLLLIGLGLAAAGGGLVLLIGRGLPMAIGVSVALLIAEVIMVRVRANRRWEVYRVQLPEALHVVASALSAGASLNQALKHAVNEIPPPLQNELRRLVEDVEVGKTLEEALTDLRIRVPLPEFDMIIASLLIQQRSGGNLAELLTQTAELIKKNQELREELSVLTSQARLSAQLIAFLPLGLFGFLYFFSRDYLDPLLTTLMGRVMLFVGALFMILGYWAVTRIATYSEYEEI